MQRRTKIQTQQVCHVPELRLQGHAADSSEAITVSDKQAWLPGSCGVKKVECAFFFCPIPIETPAAEKTPH